MENETSVYDTCHYIILFIFPESPLFRQFAFSQINVVWLVKNMWVTNGGLVQCKYQEDNQRVWFEILVGWYLGAY